MRKPILPANRFTELSLSEWNDDLSEEFVCCALDLTPSTVEENLSGIDGWDCDGAAYQTKMDRGIFSSGNLYLEIFKWPYDTSGNTYKGPRGKNLNPDFFCWHSPERRLIYCLSRLQVAVYSANCRTVSARANGRDQSSTGILIPIPPNTRTWSY